MPWEPKDKMSLKRDFVELASQSGANMSELCRRFGVSRTTGYELLARWQAEGEEGLAERSRRPKRSPWQTSEEVEKAILKARALHPVWGGRKIRRYLENKGHKKVPAASTITAVLRRHGQLGQEPGTRGEAMKRFERKAPNDLWQMDFKGHFELSSGGRCHPLTVLDDHSRYNVILRACDNERSGTVRSHLLEAFGRYGLPGEILCDNAGPWGVPDRSSRYTALGVWLLELGVNVIHGRPYHPQTQGKEERFHRTLKAEVLSRRTTWRDLEQCEGAFERWRVVYNHERSHESLDDGFPVDRYSLSARQLPEKLPEAESHYLSDDELRRVKSKGEITFRNRFFSIGQPFVGKTVALRRCAEDRYEVFYCWKSLGWVDLKAPAKPKYRYETLTQPVKDVSERL